MVSALARSLDVQVVHYPAHVLGHSGVDAGVSLDRTAVAVRDHTHDEHVPSRVQSGVLDPSEQHQRTSRVSLKQWEECVNKYCEYIFAKKL